MRAFRFQLPLVRTLMLKGVPHTRREGILLERDEQWSEASPLPGFSDETIEDVIDALRGEGEPPASLRFALQALDRPIAASTRVPFNYLLQGDHKTILNAAESASRTSRSAVKLKVGSDDLHSDIQLVRDVRSRLRADMELRLDANRAWSFSDATEFTRAISDIEYAYVEEPLQDASRLEELYAASGIRYALDETLVSEETLAAFPTVSALICKPTILGGRSAVERLVETGKPIIFSAAFESGIGIGRIVQLAAEFSPDLAAGLDTLSWLDGDVLQESPRYHDGVCTVPESIDLNHELLERIEL